MHVKLKVILASGFSYDWSYQAATVSMVAILAAT